MSRRRYIGVKRRILTDEEERAIRREGRPCPECGKAKTNVEIARKYGVVGSTISRIRSGR
jgi:hypothetical protein